MCNGQGYCVDGLLNPCSEHGCGDNHSCGDECLMGDLEGWCDKKGECQFNEFNLGCELIPTLETTTSPTQAMKTLESTLQPTSSPTQWAMKSVKVGSCTIHYNSCTSLHKQFFCVPLEEAKCAEGCFGSDGPDCPYYEYGPVEGLSGNMCC